ncbi:hypothetical protein D3C83_242780 [compost metagenome]
MLARNGFTELDLVGELCRLRTQGVGLRAQLFEGAEVSLDQVLQSIDARSVLDERLQAASDRKHATATDSV